MSLLPVGISGEEVGYQIERSLRFNSADTAYLNRTPASAGNRKTWTWSGWVKRGKLGSTQAIATAQSGVVEDSFAFLSGNTIRWYGNGQANGLTTNAVFRDPSAWYHIVLAMDTTQATASNRTKLYVNGVQQTFTGSEYLSQNTDTLFNSTGAQYIGYYANNASLVFDGYMAEVNFIDGSALDPTSFGEYNTDTGVWQPKAYTGSYGTNGFYLNFSDNSGTTSTTLGADSSGNGNNWTPNNFSVTAGAGNDSLVDTPTPYGTDTGAGGEVRGNYATWNPLWTDSSVTLANGNLQATGASNSNGLATGTIAISSGKWYWESTVLGGSSMWAAGIVKTTVATPNYSSLTTDSSYAWNDAGTKFNGQTGSSYGAASYTTNDVIGIAVDLDAGTVVFYKNGVSQGTAFTGVSGTFIPMVLCNSGASVATNFGQRPFAYTAPSGFKALCTQNLPEPTIVDGGEYFAVDTYTGTGVAQTRTIGFEPGLVWNKIRSQAYDHNLQDVLRGTGVRLISNSTDQDLSITNCVTAFNSDGYSIGTYVSINGSGESIVNWAWKANGAGVSNTDGTISSTVSANTDSGFSIVTWTGNGSNTAQSIGHGLGAVPSLVITKNRDQGAYNWQTLHSATPDRTYNLNTTDAGNTGWASFSNGSFNPSNLSSTTFSTYPGTSTSNFPNGSGEDYIAYCFAAVSGYSAFGSYTGNGSTDGPFVFTNFRPAFVMIKGSSNSDRAWVMLDVARNTYNVMNLNLYANASDAEATDTRADGLSNGFKLRGTGTWVNNSGSTYIYMAFAENPFKYSLAR